MHVTRTGQRSSRRRVRLPGTREESIVTSGARRRNGDARHVHRTTLTWNTRAEHREHATDGREQLGDGAEHAALAQKEPAYVWE